MPLDFSRSAPPCDGPLNIARSTAVACCYVALKHLFTDVPANAGCLAPIEFVIPDTTLLGVSAPAPGRRLHRDHPARHRRDLRRLRQGRARARATAARSRTINALSLAGWREHGRRWVMFCFFGGGLGGNPEGDGLNHGNNPISTATIPPVEILESLYPVMFTAMGAAAGFRRRRASIAAGSARSTRSRRWPRRRRGVPARRARQVSAVRRQRRRSRRRSTASSTRPTAARRRRRWCPRSPTSRSARGQNACGSRRRAAAASAIRRRATPSASRATCGSATSRASRAPRLQGRAARRRRVDATPPQARATTHEQADVDRRRRRRRHLHRPVPARRGERHASAPPRCRRGAATRRAGFLNGLRRARRRRGASHSIVHGTTVGTNALLERRGPQDRRHHHARLSRRAGDAPARPPPHLGPVGRFRPDRRPRPARSRSTSARSPTARIRTRGRSGRGARRGASAAGQGRARRSRSSSSTPTPMPRTSAARSPPCARSGRTSIVTASHEVLPEIREFERSSTAALNAYLQPVVGAYLGKLEAALARAELRRPAPHRAVERRHHVDRDRAQAAGAHRAVRPGRRRGRRRGASRKAAGFDNRHHLRSRRHLVRRLADRRRQGRARGADHDRFRPGHPHADDRDHHHRRRRRLDRLGRSRRPAAGRPGKRRLGARAGLLRRRATRGRR